MPSSEEVFRQVREHLSNLVGWGGQYPDKVLAAGGCIRDPHMGIAEKVKDIDIYVADGPMVVFNLKQAFSANRGWQSKALVIAGSCGYMDFPNIFAIYEFWCEGYLPVQVMIVKEFTSFDQILRQHDMGLCQIGMDLHGNTYFTEHFAHDQDNHCFTLRRCGSLKQYLRSVKRHARLVLKYPGYPLDTSHVNYKD